MALHLARLPPPMHTPYLVKEGGRRVHKRSILARMSVIEGVVNKFFDFLTPPKHKIVCMYLLTDALFQAMKDNTIINILLEMGWAIVKIVHNKFHP